MKAPSVLLLSTALLTFLATTAAAEMPSQKYEGDWFDYPPDINEPIEEVIAKSGKDIIDMKVLRDGEGRIQAMRLDLKAGGTSKDCFASWFADGTGRITKMFIPKCPGA